MDGGNWRNLSDTVLTYTPNSKLSLMANADYGRVPEAWLRLLPGTPVDWSGIAGYAKYQFNPLWALAGRYEYYNDHDGFTTSGFQTIAGYLPICFHSPAYQRNYRHGGEEICPAPDHTG